MSERESPPEWPLEDSERLSQHQMFSVRRDRVRIPRTGESREFDVVESPDGVVVLAVTPEAELVLVEQFREPMREVTLELPSGVVDEGEDPLAAGVRELREETGFEGSPAEPIGVMDLNPSWQTTRVHVVMVGEAERRAGKDLDSAEDTRVRRVPVSELREMVRSGEIRSAAALAALALAWAAETDLAGREISDLD